MIKEKATTDSSQYVDKIAELRVELEKVGTTLTQKQGEITSANSSLADIKHQQETVKVKLAHANSSLVEINELIKHRNDTLTILEEDYQNAWNRNETKSREIERKIRLLVTELLELEDMRKLYGNLKEEYKLLLVEIDKGKKQLQKIKDQTDIAKLEYQKKKAKADEEIPALKKVRESVEQAQMGLKNTKEIISETLDGIEEFCKENGIPFNREEFKI